MLKAQCRKYQRPCNTKRFQSCSKCDKITFLPCCRTISMILRFLVGCFLWAINHDSLTKTRFISQNCRVCFHMFLSGVDPFMRLYTLQWYLFFFWESSPVTILLLNWFYTIGCTSASCTSPPRINLSDSFAGGYDTDPMDPSPTAMLGINWLRILRDRASGFYCSYVGSQLPSYILWSCLWFLLLCHFPLSGFLLGLSELLYNQRRCMNAYFTHCMSHVAHVYVFDNCT